MNILFIRSNPVDPDSRVEKEVETLIKLGYHVDILAWDRNSNYKIKSEIKVINKYECHIHRIGIKSGYGLGFKKNIKPLLAFQIAIYNYLKQNHSKFDVIHACDFDTAFCSFYQSRKYKIKFIYDIFDFYVDAFSVPNIIRKIIRFLDINIINKADHVIICSEKRFEQIKGTTQSEITVIHNTPNIQINDTTEKKKLNLDKTSIVYVGIFGQGRMIEELMDIVAKDKKYELHIAGFGYLQNVVERYAKEDNIHYYGKLDYYSTLKLEKSCDIMVALYDPRIKNHIYAAPNKFYEALCLGKPLIMVKGTGFSEIIDTYKIGKTIDYTYDSLKEALNYLNSIKQDWNYISSVEQYLYRERYNWSEMETRLKKIYEKIEG